MFNFIFFFIFLSPNVFGWSGQPKEVKLRIDSEPLVLPKISEADIASHCVSGPLTSRANYYSDRKHYLKLGTVSYAVTFIYFSEPGCDLKDLDSMEFAQDEGDSFFDYFKIHFHDYDTPEGSNYSGETVPGPYWKDGAHSVPNKLRVLSYY